MINKIKNSISNNTRIFLLDIDENYFYEVFRVEDIHKEVWCKDEEELLCIPFSFINENNYKILNKNDVEGYI